MKITKQKGTRDILLKDAKIWQYVENTVRQICREYHIEEIRTPVFEATELFARGVGDETDIVNKEMYTFLDKGGRSVTLRPELTAGVVRAFIENGLASNISPLKLWYIGNMYRYEKMQKEDIVNLHNLEWNYLVVILILQMLKQYVFLMSCLKELVLQIKLS